jgi:hypothetical protein
MKSLIDPVQKATEYLDLTLQIQNCYNKPIKEERVSELISIFNKDYSKDLSNMELISAKKELELGINLYNLVKDKIYFN